MNSVDILFSTGIFNRTEVKSHFINPCCFGEDLAQWLVDHLIAIKINASAIGQEDWGWYFDVGGKYFVGVGAHASDTPEVSDFGEWRVTIQKRRTFSEWLRRDVISSGDPLVTEIATILKREPAFSNIHFE